ncbi:MULTISPECIES: endo alpha-1,4 polygalactosaminidase [unclassified Blastococcus]
MAVLLAAGCGGEPEDGDSRAVDRTGPPAAASSAPAESSSPATPTPPAPPVTSGEPDPAPPQAGQPPAGDGAHWRPPARLTWQYQLSGPLDPTVDAQVYDVDWEETTAEQVSQLHAAGRRVICYVNAGAFEEWRPDAGDYPDDVLGEPLDGWPGERWLDVRRLEVLLPLLGARLDACRAKGFDAVEFDNVDGYTNDTGFDLTADDQLRFNRAVAQLAHEREMAVGLKNDVEQVAELEPHFDFAVNEECLAFEECAAYAPFVAAGKPVLHVEYEVGPDGATCETSAALGLSSIFKDLELGPPLRRC